MLQGDPIDRWSPEKSYDGEKETYRRRKKREK
jgi:hypothetical protein